jgi:small subunit ribosomal protein S16
VSTVIRMARGGTKKRPYYRIVVADKRSARDGKYIERLGNYDPLLKDAKSGVDMERIHYWLGVGALPSERVTKLLKLHGHELKPTKRALGPGKPPPRPNRAKRTGKKSGGESAAPAAAAAPAKA